MRTAARGDAGAGAGAEIADPYRWLESPTSPDTQSWLAREGEQTERDLTRIGNIEAIRSRLHELLSATDEVSMVQVANGRLFYLRRGNTSPRPRLCAREIGGNERTLYQVATDAVTITSVVPSPDGRLVAFSVVEGGFEDVTVRVIDVGKGTLLTDRIERVAPERVAWRSGNPEIFYTHFPHFRDEQRRFEDGEVRVHKIGTSADADAVVMAAGDPSLPAVAAKDRPSIETAPGSPFALAIIAHSAGSDPRILVRDVSSGTVGGQWRTLIEPEEHISNWALVGTDLYVISRHDDPLGRVLRFDLRTNAKPQPYLDPDNARSIDDVFASRGALYVRDRDVTGTSIRRVRLRDHSVTALPIPFEAVTDLASDPSSDVMLLEAQGWTASPRWLVAHDTSATLSEALPDQQHLALAGVHVEHAAVVSRDGTQVPLTILTARDFVKASNAPTRLSAYGAYGISLSPRFLPERLAWMERGGVWAIAHVRGGGELGRAWHNAGMGEHKQNSIDDFIASAEYLISSNFTSPANLGAAGTSAGGLLVGVALTQRPDLFRAAYINVGMLNPTRAAAFGIGPMQGAEFGSPDTPDGFQHLLHVDAYEQLHTGVRYPAVLARVGLNDSRVPYWQSAKFVAKMRTYSTSGYPVLLQVAREAGHAATASVDQEAEDIASQQAFLLSQLERANGTPMVHDVGKR